MASKVLFVLATLALLVSSHALPKRDIPGNKLTGAFDGIIDFAEELLTTINLIVDEAIIQTAVAIKSIGSGLDELKEYGTQAAQELVNAETESLNKLIEDVKTRANEAELDILECVEATDKEAGDIQTQALNSSLSCIDSAIQQVEDSILDILIDIKTLNEDLLAEEQNLELCKKELIPINCIENVFNNVVSTVLTLPAKIQPDADKAQQDFEELGGKLQACATQSADDLREGAARVFNELSQCVWDKEHN